MILVVSKGSVACYMAEEFATLQQGWERAQDCPKCRGGGALGGWEELGLLVSLEMGVSDGWTLAVLSGGVAYFKIKGKQNGER